MIRLLFLIAFSAIFLSADVGKIVELKGFAVIERIEESNTTSELNASVDQAVLVGDILITNEKTAQIQLEMSDGTKITVGGDSRFVVEDFSDDRASFELKGGTFRAITGKIGKVAPQNFKVKTRTATMGIRGTDFVAKLANDGLLESACVDGAISVGNEFGETVVEAGNISTTSFGSAPSEATPIPAGFLEGFGFGLVALVADQEVLVEDRNETVAEVEAKPSRVFVEFGEIEPNSFAVVIRDESLPAPSDQNRTLVFGDEILFKQAATITTDQGTIRAAANSKLALLEDTNSTSTDQGVFLIENIKEFAGAIFVGQNSKAIVAFFANKTTILVLEGGSKMGSTAFKAGYYFDGETRREYTEKELFYYTDQLNIARSEAKKYEPKPKIYKF